MGCFQYLLVSLHALSDEKNVHNKADCSSTVNLCALRHVDMEPLQRPRPSVNDKKASRSWTPYPKQMDPIPSHLSCLFHRQCDLCCIMIIITRTFFNSEDRPSPSEVPAIGKNIKRQLQGWYANLPDCLRVRETTVPHILCLQYVRPIVPVGCSVLCTDIYPQLVLSHSVRTAL